MAAVAVGQVVKGDKTDRVDMAQLNSGTVADVVELEGDEDTGADSHVEVKVPSPLVKNLGKGGKGKGGSGTAMAVGHLYAHGNTDEPYRVGVLGVKTKGRKGGPHFNHWTGQGYVLGQQGKYHDALSKGARVTVMLVESTGAISARSLRYVSYLTRRSRGPNARDATRYGRNRMSATSFYTHHTQRLSMAAACGDVRGIMESVRGLKQRMLASGATAGAQA